MVYVILYVYLLEPAKTILNTKTQLFTRSDTVDQFRAQCVGIRDINSSWLDGKSALKCTQRKTNRNWRHTNIHRPLVLDGVLMYPSYTFFSVITRNDVRLWILNLWLNPARAAHCFCERETLYWLNRLADLRKRTRRWNQTSN